MELSAELLERTLNQIKGDGGVGGVERRISPRVGLRCRVKLLPVQQGRLGPPLEVWTRDISRTGLGVMCPHRVKAGTHFVLTLTHHDDPEKAKVVLYCTVRNCDELVRGIYAVGLSFEALHASEAKLTAAAPAAATCDAPAKDDELSRIRSAILS